MWEVILYGVLAGIVGTLIGGIISCIIGKKDSVISYLFCFAAGIMLAIVCFDLIPESLNYSKNVWTVAVSILAGALIVVLLDVIIKIKSPKTKIDEKCTSRTNMAKMGVLMMLAIALHNLPEGLVIGSSEVSNKGLFMAIMIGLHNIPEGIAVAAPLIASGTKKWKAVLLTALTGAPTLIGAIIGYYVGMKSEAFAAISLGIASGAMLCIIFSDMIPEALLLNKTKKTGYAIFGSFIIGMVLIYCLL